MDMIENIANKASQITMYDLKSYYNQAKNAVLNIPEMEAKVREATNEDAWGASSTLMQEIAQGTHNYQHFNEIMPTIYSRFMEKEAREWRQIYKALSLLEYLIKHGSERVVDDARAHISTIKMLRNFQYIDEKGKDQGINVRNRSNEIAALLGDVDKIRTERRKARSNRSKYQGHEGGMFNTATGSRYGGFGSESYVPGGGGSGGGGGYGGGSGSGSGSRYGGYGNDDDYRGSSARASSSQQRQEYDEYEGADDFDSRRPSNGSGGASAQASRPTQAPPKPPKDEPKKQQKQPEVNLFDFDDEPVASAAQPAAPAAAPVDAFGDDDFDDFQSAAPSGPVPTSPAAAAPAAPSGGANANLFAMLNASSQPLSPTSAASTSAVAQTQPSFGGMSAMASPQRQQPMGGIGMGGMSSGMGGGLGGMGGMSGGMTAKPASPPVQAPKKTGASAFDDLFTASLGAPSKGQQGGGQKTIAQMQKETTNAGLWGAPKPAGQQTQAQPASSSGSGDLLDLL
ncbi:hypothetical protein CcaverHIS002_0411000 [Cutaneotrichosporon cavernicola]|uniref:ENTH domain-containing protein n=1 Tax=Cutaneotrichosporon cavernicola TaxID=279322 RepID=A0AA48L5B7_9TREE|nr:uncharacterized protein CcaverHIS019_0410910 [Cutaneotrichosporon cavernicola]BEI84496.1 hypothetical protein CcaverHIS002_0411000 [Cutaneotrichosporon cavernicola]BEI92271.1 hypothetical protein CcaverHIS019_0410910 [Cutaneotrichosporon cavernicola]BEJ00043.1 hypothetical protein CcaverHIS631_0410850 [Cutaneotrichosporon cavernicola]BEJ07815.1 hypothetical protein CcaverHIS641_0410840 [Cutaneotrichosporon cavernicola]